MNRERYEAVTGFFYENDKARYALQFTYHFLPLLLFVAYPALLIYTLIQYGFDEVFLKVLLVPFFTLAVVTVVRRLINAERPYERYGIPSVFNKQTVRQSLPSRHTASAFIIAMSFWYIFPPLGIAAMVVSVLIALSRVLSGAHFIRDVLVAAGTSILIGWVVYFLMD